MRAGRNPNRLTDGTRRVPSGRWEAGLTETSDRGIEITRQQVEVAHPETEICGRRLQFEKRVSARLIVATHSLGIRAAKRECDSKPHNVLIELRRCGRVS